MTIVVRFFSFRTHMTFYYLMAGLCGPRRAVPDGQFQPGNGRDLVYIGYNTAEYVHRVRIFLKRKTKRKILSHGTFPLLMGRELTGRDNMAGHTNKINALNKQDARG